MIEVEGKIINHHVAILIDSGASCSYIDPKIVDRFHLEKSNLEKSCLVQLTTGTKRLINETVKHFPISMNCVNTNVDLNIQGRQVREGYFMTLEEIKKWIFIGILV
jgi:hypothetical protein